MIEALIKGIALGLLLSISGIVLFFDTVLLSTGNIVLICGVLAIVGMQKAIKILSNKHQIKSSMCLIFGVFMVFLKHPIIGIILELISIIFIFGNTIPYLFSFTRQSSNIFGSISGDSYFDTVRSFI